MKTLITMTNQEIDRYEILRNLLSGKINGSDASIQMGLSTRQVRRLKRQVKEWGVKGIIHKNRGAVSHNKTPDEVKDKIIKYIKKDYYDFGPTFAQEKLVEINKIKLSVPTVRNIMIEKGFWQVRKIRKKEYHSWRERKECFGEMIQFDGSYHDWFETGEKYCLLGGADDATGRVEARFYLNEGVIPVFKYWKRYLKKQGKPISIYLDKYSTYKVNLKSSPNNLTRFQAVMKGLDIKVIHAHSPQAKGRVERIFKTLQDRLVKELRLKNIKDPKEANQFLEEIFLPKFNLKFNVVPKQEKNLHIKLNQFERRELNSIFSIQDYAAINNDYTVRHKGIWYQLIQDQPLRIYPGNIILIEKELMVKYTLEKTSII